MGEKGLVIAIATFDVLIWTYDALLLWRVLSL
jgi:hypothetical protein